MTALVLAGGDDGAEPLVPVEVWRAAADAIDERGWAQHELRGQRGTVCLLGALDVALVERAEWDYRLLRLAGRDYAVPGATREQLVRFSLAALAARLWGRSAEWNDSLERTKEQVTAWLRQAPAFPQGHLAVFLGAGWRPLLRTVGALAELDRAERARLTEAVADLLDEPPPPATFDRLEGTAGPPGAPEVRYWHAVESLACRVGGEVALARWCGYIARLALRQSAPSALDDDDAAWLLAPWWKVRDTSPWA